MGAIKQRTYAALSIMDIPPEVRSEKSRMWNDHFLNRGELRGRVIQLNIALYARLAAKLKNYDQSVIDRWKEILGIDLDAAMITIERGYASPSEKLVTPQYLASILSPVMDTILSAFVNSDLYSDPRTKMNMFIEGIQMSVSYARGSRWNVVKSFFVENYAEIGADISTDQLSLISLAWKTFLAVLKDAKLHYVSRRTIFESKDRVTVYSYPRLTQHVIEKLYNQKLCEISLTEVKNVGRTFLGCTASGKGTAYLRLPLQLDDFT